MYAMRLSIHNYTEPTCIIRLTTIEVYSPHKSLLRCHTFMLLGLYYNCAQLFYNLIIVVNNLTP